MIFRLILIVLLFFGGDNPAFSAFCPEAGERCASLKNYPYKYNICAKAVCTQAEEDRHLNAPIQIYSNEDVVAKKIPIPKEYEGKACQKGLYKCVSKTADANEYWSCMAVECRSEDANSITPYCTKGQKSCLWRLSRYNDCTANICGGDICDDGKKKCTAYLDEYWTCTKKICLGGISKTYSLQERLFRDEQRINGPLLQDAMLPFNVNISPTYRTHSPGGMASPMLICPLGGQRYCSSYNPFTCVCQNGKPAFDLYDAKIIGGSK